MVLLDFLGGEGSQRDGSPSVRSRGEAPVEGPGEDPPEAGGLLHSLTKIAFVCLNFVRTHRNTVS